MALNAHLGPHDAIEELSAIQHEIWIEWMIYLYQVSQQNTDGTVIIPAEKVSRWKRQIETPYRELSEKEKQSDRKQAHRILDSLHTLNIGIDNISANSVPQEFLDQPNYGLFTKPFKKLTEQEFDALREQYKMYVEMSDKISERRQQANTFLLTINTALIAALSGFLTLTQYSLNQYSWIILASCAGIIFCMTWRRLIISYKQLNRGKFKIIHALEEYLPARLFYAEWNALNKGDGTLYTEFTKIEPNVPLAFIGLYIVLAAFSLISSF